MLSAAESEESLPPLARADPGAPRQVLGGRNLGAGPGQEHMLRTGLVHVIFIYRYRDVMQHACLHPNHTVVQRHTNKIVICCVFRRSKAA